MTARTSQYLADTLRAAGFSDLAERAERDEFHDFLSTDAMCAITLSNALYEIARDPGRKQHERIAAHNIRLRHHDGDFDASKEESDAWAASEEGKAAFRKLARGK